MTRREMPSIDRKSLGLDKRTIPKQSDKPKVRQEDRIINKPSIAKQFTSSFSDNERGNIGKYIVQDVIMPSVRNAAYDAIAGGMTAFVNAFTNGLQSVFFGEQGVRKQNKAIGSSRTPYSKISSGISSASVNTRTRSSSEVPTITFKSKASAEDIVDTLLDIIEEFGVATVRDFNALVDLPRQYTDINFGWSDLSNVSVDRVREGYMLTMPKPKSL